MVTTLYQFYNTINSFHAFAKNLNKDIENNHLVLNQMKKATFEKLAYFLSYAFQSSATKYTKAKVVAPVTPELEKVYQTTKLLVREMGRILDAELLAQVLE